MTSKHTQPKGEEIKELPNITNIRDMGNKINELIRAHNRTLTSIKERWDMNTQDVESHNGHCPSCCMGMR